MASSSLAIAFEFFIGASIVIQAAHSLSLRFGWKSADSTLACALPTATSP
jgi:hypothetical protein